MRLKGCLLSDAGNVLCDNCVVVVQKVSPNGLGFGDGRVHAWTDLVSVHDEWEYPPTNCVRGFGRLVNELRECLVLSRGAAGQAGVTDGWAHV